MERFIFKIITMGDANVGKTALCCRICETHEDLGYMPTIGIEFNRINMDYNDTKITLQLWDTAGQECFAPIIRNYYKNIVGIFFVIDITCQKSIDKIDYWLEEFDKYRIQTCETIIIAIGNKIDLNDRVISYDKISQIFKKKNIDYFEVSAKNNINVTAAKMFLIDQIFDKFDLNDHPGIYQKNNNKLIVKSRDTCSYVKNDSCCCIS
jgi:small GTP-binding protein